MYVCVGWCGVCVGGVGGAEQRTPASIAIATLYNYTHACILYAA